MAIVSAAQSGMIAAVSVAIVALGVSPSPRAGNSPPVDHAGMRLTSTIQFEGGYIDQWTDGTATVKTFGAAVGVAPTYASATVSVDGRERHSVGVKVFAMGPDLVQSTGHQRVSIADVARAMGEPAAVVADQAHLQAQYDAQEQVVPMAGRPPVCSAFDNGKIHTYGCDSETEAKHSSGRYYLAHRFQLSGWSTDTALWFPNRVTRLKATDGEPSMPGNGANGQGLYTWSPGGTSYLGNCSTKTFSVSVGGAGFSQSHSVCPDSIGPTDIEPGGVFQVTWNGTEPSANFYEDAHGVDGWNLSSDPAFFYYTNVSWN